MQNDNGLYEDALIIKINNKIIFEEYKRAYDENSKHLSWSVAKTISGIMVAQAVEQGHLTLDERLYDIFPGFKGEASVKDVLEMSSGIQFEEIYSGIPVSADVTKMLYLNGPEIGFAKYTLSLPLRIEKPGEHFYYSSGDTNILMAILKKKLPEDIYNDFPWINLFNPLEIDATFEQDSKGVFVGSSYLYMSGKDYLKLADLISSGGIYKTVQMIPTWYIKMMSKVAYGVKNPLNGTSNKRKYSSQTTTNLGIEYKYLPKDSLLMLGHQGQIVASSPKNQMSVVRLATDKGSSLNKDEFFREVYDTIIVTGADLSIEEVEYKEDEVTNKKVLVKNSVNISDYFKVPKLITSLAAKELCSCYFVVGRSLEQCRRDLEISLPIVPLIRIVNGEVKAFMNVASPSIAKYRGKKLGCYLTSF